MSGAWYAGNHEPFPAHSIFSLAQNRAFMKPLIEKSSFGALQFSGQYLFSSFKVTRLMLLQHQNFFSFLFLFYFCIFLCVWRLQHNVIFYCPLHNLGVKKQVKNHEINEVFWPIFCLITLWWNCTFTNTQNMLFPVFTN